MDNQEITVVYKWTAKPGKAEEFKIDLPGSGEADEGNRARSA